MKKLFALLAVVLAVVSCQKDADLGVNVGGEQLVNITVALPEETRAASGTGFDLTTLEANGLELRYILEIYVEDTNAVNDQKRIRKEAYTTATSDVVFPVRLVAGQNRNYRIVAWADIVPADANRTEDGDYDYYYETSEGLDQILINEAKWTAMKEQRDAYTAFKVVKNFSANSVINLTLKRPFAKVRVVSTDIKDIEDLGYELKNGTVEYSVDLNRQFNALYGTASNAAAKSHSFEYPTVYFESGDSYETDTQRTLFADYIFVDKTWEQDAIQFTMSVYEDGGLLKTTTFNTDIALHANTLTTIIGEVLTEGGYVNIEINGELNEVNKYTVVSSASQLLKVLNSGEEYILGNNIVVTTADLNEFKPIITRGNNETKTTIINLNGYTVTIQNDGTGEPVVLESGNTLIFAGEGSIVNQGTGALVDNSNEDANVVVTGGATVANGTTTKAVLTGREALVYICENGGEFTFAKDLTSSEILSITADNVVINGNGFAFTSNAPRAINVDGADGVVIKNLNIVASRERAINLINGGTNVTVENVTAKAANYTFNVAGSSAGAVAIIKNSDLTGLNTVNIAAENTNVTITNTKLTTVDNTEVENYATIAVNKYAEGSKVAVNGGEVVITGTHCDGCKVASVGSDNSEVTFDGTVGATNDDVVIIYFATIYSDGTYYGHATLDEAIAQSEKDNGSVITLIRNYTTSEPLIIANDKSLTINLNGKTITGAFVKDGGALIENNGTLKIVGGTLKNTYTNGDAVINNSGELVLEDVKIEGAPIADGSYPAYAVISSGKMIINNGTEVSSDRGCLKLSNDGETVINGGTFVNNDIGSSILTSHVVDVENGGSNKLTINGGTFEHRHATTNGGVVICNRTKGTVYVNGGNFSGGNYYGINNLSDYGYGGTFSVTGGTYTAKPDASYLADGYKAIEKNSKYVVVPADAEVVSTADEFVAALEAQKNVLFMNDIKIDPANMSNAYGATGINVLFGQTIDGNGYTLNIKGAGGTWDSGINTTGGLIKNLTITGSFRGIFINHTSTHSEKVILENVTIGGNGTVYTISCDQGLYQTIEATNCTFNGWTSYAEDAGEAKFINCSFGAGSGYKYCRPYSNTEFVNCTFCPGYAVDTTIATVTFTDCTWEE